MYIYLPKVVSQPVVLSRVVISKNTLFPANEVAGSAVKTAPSVVLDSENPLEVTSVIASSITFKLYVMLVAVVGSEMS